MVFGVTGGAILVVWGGVAHLEAESETVGNVVEGNGAALEGSCVGSVVGFNWMVMALEPVVLGVAGTVALETAGCAEFDWAGFGWVASFLHPINPNARVKVSKIRKFGIISPRILTPIKASDQNNFSR